MLRHADPARDARACAAIYAPFVRHSSISFEEEPPAAGELAQRIAQVALTHPWLVLEHDERVVGFAYGSPHRTRRAYRWVAEVSVYVDSAHHRRGAGRALYVALLELLRAQRLHVACAGITLPNAASVGLHQSLGFAPIGVYQRIGWKAGGWHDVGWWQLGLRDAQAQRPEEPLGPQRLPC